METGTLFCYDVFCLSHGFFYCLISSPLATILSAAGTQLA